MILGNLGHESVGMTAFQEKNPINGGRGGWGWAQWTGPRRRAFEKYAAERGLDPKSYEANYGYLRAELSGQIPGLNYKKSIDAIRGQTDLHQGIKDFENSFEKSDPRYKGYASRYKYGDRAMALPDAAGGSTAQASPSSSGAGKPTLPVPPSWTPSTSGRVGGASTSSMHAPITIQGGNQDPQAVADAVQRRIEDSMKWRTHDIDHQMT